MKKFGVFALIVALCGGVQAKWYWPLDAGAVDDRTKRVSELIEPASNLIDEASDLAADGKTDEAVAKYRKALEALNLVEMENPERAKSDEFATLRNKRAYVNAAIDSLLLGQVRANAKAVVVSETSELEKRLDRERWGKLVDKASESVDHRASDAALAELEKARTGTTNAVLIAVAHGVTAGVHCQKGAFAEARRALAQSRQELARAGKLTDEEQRLVANCLLAVRKRIVVGHRKAIDAGCQACDGCAGLEKTGVLTTNSAELARGVVDALEAESRHLGVFAFPTAQKLRAVSSNVLARVAVLLESTEDGKEPKWDVDVSGLKSALTAFDALSPEIKGVDASLLPLLKMVGEEVEALSSVRREQAMKAIADGDFETAERLVGELLAEKPDGALALNLKAVLEARQGKLEESENTLERAMLAHPRNHFAYYNMANLMLQVRPDDKSIAKRYYETGRGFGGPVNVRLEEAFK